MAIPINSGCIACHLNRYIKTAQALGDEKAATAFTKALLRLYADAPEGVSGPWFSDKVAALLEEYCGLSPHRYRREKEQSNRFALERVSSIKARVAASAEPIYAGLQIAILGNYLDFSALQGEVSFDALEEMLTQAEEMKLDRDCYRALLSDLEKGKKLLYLTDNAGEIVFDRVLAEEIQRKFPHLEIIFCVRGGPAVNDATREDAALAEIPFRVIDNGTCIAGTIPEQVGQEARQELAAADVILAKGQGNCETLYGCELNIYYAFLVKCSRFVQEFNLPKFTPVLTK